MRFTVNCAHFCHDCVLVLNFYPKLFYISQGWIAQRLSDVVVWMSILNNMGVNTTGTDTVLLAQHNHQVWMGPKKTITSILFWIYHLVCFFINSSGNWPMGLVGSHNRSKHDEKAPNFVQTGKIGKTVLYYSWCASFVTVAHCIFSKH